MYMYSTIDDENILVPEYYSSISHIDRLSQSTST